MTCITDGTVTICRPPRQHARCVRECPTCGRRRRFVALVQVYYDTMFTCCGCGDRWSAGERHERPFQRAWRSEATAAARRAWAEGCSWSDKMTELEQSMRDLHPHHVEETTC